MPFLLKKKNLVGISILRFAWIINSDCLIHGQKWDFFFFKHRKFNCPK